MRLKILLGLFVIIAIVGLLIFSDKGKSFRQRYLDRYLQPMYGPITGLFKGITGKFRKPKQVNRTLDIMITTDMIALQNQEFYLEGNFFDGILKPNEVSIGDQIINFRDDSEFAFKINGLNGIFLIDGNGDVQISGQADSIEINEMEFISKPEQKNIEFSIIGRPVTFSLEGIDKDKIILSGTTGALRLEDWSPLALNNDNLEITNFLGSINQEDEMIVLTGRVEEAILNGVSLAPRS